MLRAKQVPGISEGSRRVLESLYEIERGPLQESLFRPRPW